MKVCSKCNIEQPFSEFYKHKKMGDGHLSDCKTCVKKRVREREEKLRQDPEWSEKERKRHREKYSRLNYKEKQKEWDADKPWKATQIYKNLSRNFSTPKGVELHHWNYNTKYLTDVVMMERKEHKYLHKFLTFVSDKRIFKTKTELLDTREKHLDFIESLGLKYIKPTKN